MAWFSGWIAKHTGLPSFHIRASNGERVKITGAAGDQTWTAISYTSDGSEQFLSDPLAPPGVAVTYRVVGGSTVWTATRPAPGVTSGNREGEWWRGIVTTVDGRVLDALAWEGDGDETSWDSDVHVFNEAIARWPLHAPPVEGKGTFTLYEPAREREVMSFLRSTAPLLLQPATPTPALPARAITVKSVGRKRLTGEGVLEFSVSWTVVPLDSPMLRRPDGGAGVPVLVWGTWDDFDHQWRDRTYTELLRLIAGKP